MSSVKGNTKSFGQFYFDPPPLNVVELSPFEGQLVGWGREARDKIIE
jgi:hypothetical protein